MSKLTIEGTIIHCLKPHQLEVIESGHVRVKNKQIVQIGRGSVSEARDGQHIQLTNTQLLIPGFVDTHIHAPQYPNMGLGYDKQLLDWLKFYTFKQEQKYEDLQFAKNIYSKVVQTTLGCGTTTASYFATIHVDSSVALAEAAIQQGQRALVGLVNMIKNAPVDLLQESVSHSVRDTETFIQSILSKSELVKPSITPRFALSCNEELLAKLGHLAELHNLNIQSHICENKQEIIETLKLYPNAKSYAEIYDQGNLLTDKTIMAHAVHLTKDEALLLAKRKTSVAHCPNSNTCLQSGLADVQNLIKAGVIVGLGTDVSGGSSPSIIKAMQSALDTSTHISYKTEEYQPLNYKDVFYLATLGGAQALSMEGTIGNFIVGKEFDALIIDVADSFTTPEMISECTPLELLQKFIYTGDDRNVKQVYVAGRNIKSI